MKTKRICSLLVSAVMGASMVAMMPAIQPVTFADVIQVNDGFEVNFDGWTNEGDLTVLKANAGSAYNSGRGLKISNRQSSADRVYSEKGLYLDGGTEYDYSIFVRNDGEKAEEFNLSLRYLYPDGETYGTDVLDTEVLKPGEWTELSASYTAPDTTVNLTLFLASDGTADFSFDNAVVVERDVKQIKTVDAAANVGLKDIYANYFRVGNILNGSTVNDSTAKAIVLKNYNSITFENELKPDSTLNKSGSSDTNIAVSLNNASSILNFCAQNNIGVRGHTFVWHSQTPQWFFKQGFNDSGSWVDKATMNKRMESYIKNMFATIKERYPGVNLYAYDVVNEATSDDSNRTANNGGARVPGYGNGASPYVQIYGDNSFIEQAFIYAKQYAPETCSLFYNDYNEYWDHKRNSIVKMAKGLFDKGLLDGVGMQSHINADMNGFSGAATFTTALNMYADIGCQVQITELDISTENSKFSASQQAEKYKAVFQAAIDRPEVTAVCVWSPYDKHTWIKSENAPSLHDYNGNTKAAYDTVCSLIPQSEWGDGNNPTPRTGPTAPPQTPVEPDENGYYFHHTYESGVDSWAARGGTTVASSGISAYAGEKALAVSGRTDAWNGAEYTLNSKAFKAGEAYSFSAMVMQSSGAPVDMQLSLQYTDSSGETAYDHIKVASAASGVWTQLANTKYTIPSGASNAVFYVETLDSTTNFYVDEAIGAVSGTVIVAASKGSGQRGDVDNDGVVNATDVSLAQRAMIKAFSDKGMTKRADIDGDGSVTAADVALLKQFVLGKLDEFPKIVSKIDTAAMDQLFSGITPAKSYKNEDENNALYTQRFGADPGFMVYKDRLYVYMTNDDFEYSNGQIKENSYDVQEINCISSTDLVNWTDHGAIPVAGRSGAATWASCSWAPDACWKTINGKDKFFLYFANSGGGIGVLTADSPEGPWRDPIGKALVTGGSPNCQGIPWMFDPAVLVDDDGTGYLYFGGGVDGKDASNPGTARAVKLGDDMTSLGGTPVQLNPPYLFEDSSILKIGDTYYYSYCTNFSVPGGNPYGMNSGEIGYMTSKNPLGPFTYQGIMFKNPASYSLDSGGNNHHSLVQFKGTYYLLYHARAVEKRMGVSKNYRSPHINVANVGADGKVSVTGTMKGVNQLETLSPYQTIQAETMWRQGGIQISGLGNTVVSDIQKGDWIAVQGVNFKNGASSITVRASSKSGAAIKICAGSPTGEAIGYVEVPATNGSFTEITAPVNNVDGTKNIYFVFSGDMEFDTWSFAE